MVVLVVVVVVVVALTIVAGGGDAGCSSTERRSTTVSGGFCGSVHPHPLFSLINVFLQTIHFIVQSHKIQFQIFHFRLYRFEGVKERLQFKTFGIPLGLQGLQLKFLLLEGGRTGVVGGATGGRCGCVDRGRAAHDDCLL